MITIVDYLPEHQPYFEKFNRQWIEELFEMEPVDEWVLSNPAKSILDPGGAILMALFNGEVAGTVGLRKADHDVFEFTKMAVGSAFRNRGIGEALAFSSFRKASQLGARTIILYSNKKNEAAIRLYRRIGFKHLQVEKGVYKRADVKMSISISEALNAAHLYDQKHQLQTQF